MIFSAIGASIASSLGLKGAFVTGFFLLSVMVFSQILTVWRAQQIEDGVSVDSSFFMKREVVITILFIGQILTGSGQAIIWVAQGEYMSKCASEDSQGFYFGLFWCIYMSSQIFGNFIGSEIITQTFGPVFFIIMGTLMIAVVITFLFLRKPKPFENVAET